MLGTESHPAGTSHFTLFTFFSSIFQELSFQISAPVIYGPFTPCSPSLLKKQVFFFFFCICASVCWRRNRPWPPSSNPRTSTCTRLISSACASYRLPPFPACHPHPWMTGLLKPTRPNPLILLLRGCPADWSLDPYFFFLAKTQPRILAWQHFTATVGFSMLTWLLLHWDDDVLLIGQMFFLSRWNYFQWFYPLICCIMRPNNLAHKSNDFIISSFWP